MNNSIETKPSYKKLIFILLSITILAFLFWTGSRYPALNEKAMMGESMPLTGIGFNEIFELSEEDSKIITVIKTTINWVDTNLKGMTFGVLFASLILMLFSWLGRITFKNRFLEALIGLFIGAPLGVCVNCAAPIAFAARKANLSISSSLALMISSPSFNVVVLTMLFSLFNPVVAFVKIASSLFLVLIIVPFIASRSSVNHLKADISSKNLTIEFLVNDNQIFKNESILKSLIWFFKIFFKSLLYVIKTTVPYMLLAGFIGSLMITFVDWNSIIDLSFWASRSGYMIMIPVVLILSIIGTILPVPMAFDVIVVAVLLNANIEFTLALPLLATLGVVSIYSLLIIQRAINIKTAAYLFLSVVGIGFITGFIGRKIDQKYRFSEELALQVAREANTPKAEKLYQYTKINGELSVRKPLSIDTVNSCIIEKYPFEAKSTGASKFEMIEGGLLGLALDISITPFEYQGAAGHGQSTTVADINNDGWDDLLFGSTNGLQCFINQSGKSFTKQNFNHPLLDGSEVNISAYLDLNNDGFKDLICSAFGKGIYIFYSSDESFKLGKSKKITFGKYVGTARTLSFSDVNDDGFLDVFCGNYSLGHVGDNGYSLKSSSDYLILNYGDSLISQKFNAPEGSTLTSLFSDIDNSGKADLFIGVDFDQPDWCIKDFSLNNVSNPTNSFIDKSTFYTMSISSADIDNDLDLDFYIAQIANEQMPSSMKTKNPEKICSCFNSPQARKQCLDFLVRKQKVNKAKRYRDTEILDKNELEILISSIYSGYLKSNSEVFQELKTKGFYHDRGVLYEKGNLIKKVLRPSNNSGKHLEQELRSNLFYINTENEFTESASDFNLDYTGYSWNAQFADINNDEWQDIFIPTGINLFDLNELNSFFLNQKGRTFRNVTEELEIDNYLNMNSSVYIDFDNDGDLDIVAYSQQGFILVYKNNYDLNSFQISFNQLNNKPIIGSKIYLNYGDNREQMREIKLGEGYMSYNSITAHFGLGDNEQINSIQIISKKDTIVINKPFPSNQKIHITLP